MISFQGFKVWLIFSFWELQREVDRLQQQLQTAEEQLRSWKDGEKKIHHSSLPAIDFLFLLLSRPRT